MSFLSFFIRFFITFCLIAPQNAVWWGKIELITFLFLLFLVCPAFSCASLCSLALRLRFYLDVPLANVCCCFTATELKPTEQLRQQSCRSNFEKFQCDVDVLEVDPIEDLKLARAWAFTCTHQKLSAGLFVCVCVCELWASEAQLASSAQRCQIKGERLSELKRAGHSDAQLAFFSSNLVVRRWEMWEMFSHCGVVDVCII